MFRSVWYKSGANLKRTASIINGESISSSSLLAPPTAKYFLFQLQNRNVVVPISRVSSVFFSSFSTTASNNRNVTSDSGSSFVVSYLINSCGLSENRATTASQKLNFKTTTKPDSVLTLLKAYGFTESHISELISRYPLILSCNPHETLNPKFDFFNSKGLYGTKLADLISKDPTIARQSLNKVIIRSFDILKTIVQSDQNVIKLIHRSPWILNANLVKRLMVNVELLRNQGVPQINISKYLISQPRTFNKDADSFREIVQKIKEMGFDHLQKTFIRAIVGFASMREANWRKKMDVYKRCGWSEDQIQSAFRKFPGCMTVSEKKIMAVMNFLVNEMGYDSSNIAENPIVTSISLKHRIIPRCSVIKILVSKGLIQENIPINSLSKLVDESFLEKFVKKYEQEVPQIIKVFQGQLNYHALLQN